jgi:putative transcriptional regulator
MQSYKKLKMDIVMDKSIDKFPALVKEARRQLGISQEELAHELGVSFATINRWENGKTTPFKLARAQFDAFCKKMTKRGRLKLSGGRE